MTSLNEVKNLDKNLLTHFVQKQSLADGLQSKCPQKFRIHRKTPVLESLFNKVPSLKDCGFIIKETFFHVHIAKFLRTDFW